MRFAKEAGPAVLLVGHVTKGGGIAGPRTLEHIVDTVLYFEGEASLDHRILRAVKNRFGSVDEIGVFRMTGTGLEPVPDPAAAFLASRVTGVSGSAVTALLEGSRPMLVEIQALATKAGFGTPQRVATGLDQRRLALLLAVLERRGSLPFGNLDVFVNVTGGMRLFEPSTDLAVMAALVSSVHDRPVPADALFLGEVGLGGEIRPVVGVERRLAEAIASGIPARIRERPLARRVTRESSWWEWKASVSSPAVLPPEVGVIIVAAGAGVRAGSGEPKQFRSIHGVPLLLRALRPFTSHPEVGRVTVVLPVGSCRPTPRMARQTAG